ncbi:MAG: Holliday junction resolvase RuvX [Bifidobacteriaceae bacterium]|nr:Holliday junction resolvase RuvX [Bifidobacteriaceae bacterium]
MPVWMGVDLGNARVGLALSDPELTFAHPAGNVLAYGDYDNAMDDVLNAIEDNDVSHVVVGHPLSLDGHEGASARKARAWSERLRYRCVVEGFAGTTVELLDERLTTVTAHRQLSEAGVSSRRHRPSVDQQSATVILQTALDRRGARVEDAPDDVDETNGE